MPGLDLTVGPCKYAPAGPCWPRARQGKAKFIYIAHFIHSGNSQVLYIKESEIVIHSNKNKELNNKNRNFKNDIEIDLK